MNPICDIDPNHGEMKPEPMYGVGGEILQYGWFCQVPDCDGYGGPVVKAKVKKVAVSKPDEQMKLFVTYDTK